MKEVRVKKVTKDATGKEVEEIFYLRGEQWDQEYFEKIQKEAPPQEDKKNPGKGNVVAYNQRGTSQLIHIKQLKWMS